MSIDQGKNGDTKTGREEMYRMEEREREITRVREGQRQRERERETERGRERWILDMETEG